MEFNATASHNQAKKLQKIRQACDCCHARKIRCDGASPCANCQTTELICTYLAIPKKKGPKGRRISRNEDEARKRFKRPKTGQQVPLSNERAQEVPRTFEANEKREPSEKSSSKIPGFERSLLISDSLVRKCVDAFFVHKYPIMPILDRDKTYATLLHLDESPEKYALFTALCAVIILQPEILEEPSIPGHPINHSTWNQNISSDDLIRETVRARQFCNYIESPTLTTVQTSFFLFAALFCLGKDNSAWFYIREAMTILQVLRLHEESTYTSLQDESQTAFSRRTFWLLFITERAYALQRHRPLTLQRTISLPQVAPGAESKILSGFLDLVSLFQNFDDDFLSLWNISNSNKDSATSPQSLIQLQNILKFAIPNVAERTEIQQADLLVSRQWLKTMVWQLCVTKRLLSSNSSNESMSFHYPITIAREVVLVSRLLSPKAFEANGIGILEKVFDIGCSLADVLLLHPKYVSLSGMEIGPKDYLMELVRVLGTAGQHSSGSERFLRVLTGKADECLGVRLRGNLSESEDSRRVEEVDDDKDDNALDHWEVGQTRDSFSATSEWETIIGLDQNSHD